MFYAIAGARWSGGVEVCGCGLAAYAPSVRRPTRRGWDSDSRPERWRRVVEGVGFPDDSGRGRLRRLELVADVVTEYSRALQLPRPLGHLGPLSMIAFVPPDGESLAELLDTEREAEALNHVARALACFHSLQIDLAKERETSRDVRSVGRRVERLEETSHPEAFAARALFTRLVPLLDGVGERRSPVVKGLHLRHLRVGGAGAGASLLHDVLWAEPLLTVGELLAQLRSHALKHGVPPSAAEYLSRTYAEASGSPEHEMAAFEALSLLGRACRRGVKDPTDPLVSPLIRTAREIVMKGEGGNQSTERT